MDAGMEAVVLTLIVGQAVLLALLAQLARAQAVTIRALVARALPQESPLPEEGTCPIETTPPHWPVPTGDSLPNPSLNSHVGSMRPAPARPSRSGSATPTTGIRTAHR